MVVWIFGGMGSSVPLENKAAPQEKSPAEARPHQTAKVPAATRSQSKDECVRFDNGNARVQRGHLETRGEWFAMRQFGDGCVRPPSMITSFAIGNESPKRVSRGLGRSLPGQISHAADSTVPCKRGTFRATGWSYPGRCTRSRPMRPRGRENPSSCVVKRHAIVSRG